MYYNMYVHNNSSYIGIVSYSSLVDNYVLFICAVVVYVCSYMERTGSVNYMDFG